MWNPPGGHPARFLCSGRWVLSPCTTGEAPLVFVTDVTALGVLYTRLGEPKCAFL